MIERMICVDVYLGGEDLSKAEGIRQRVAIRTPRNGSTYYRDENRHSALKGREANVLERIAGQRIKGIIYGVDGIFEGGINVAAKVSPEEAERIRQDSSYSISDEFELPGNASNA